MAPVRYMLFAGLAGICLFYFLLWFISPFPTVLIRDPPIKVQPVQTGHDHDHDHHHDDPPPALQESSESEGITNGGASNSASSVALSASASSSSSSSSSSTSSPSFPTSNVQLPIGIITHRPALLTRLFDYMMKSTQKVDMQNIYVLEDGFTEETSKIIEKYGAVRVRCPDQIDGLPGLNSNYRCLMKYFYDKTNADAFVFLEEDLMLSPDFYSFFAQLTPVMQKDPSVFCVSTWADNGYELYAQSAGTVTRIEHFSGYGWAISRTLYEKEIVPIKWELSGVRMWDQYMQELTRDRVCLVPEVPRTHHASGNTGVTINQVHQSSSFDSNSLKTIDIKLCDVPYVDLHPEKLTSEAYDADLAEQIKHGIFIDCKGGALDYQNSTILIYFKASSASDKVWNDATSWFGLWGTGNGGAQRGVSRGMVSISYATNRMFIIATYSPLVARLQDKFSGVTPLVMGHAEHGDGRFGGHNCRKQPPFVPREMEIVYGDKGDSCTQACEKKGQKCRLDYLPYVNFCEKQKEIAGACDECRNLRAADPSFAIPYVREAGNKKTCVHSHHEKWLNCDGVEPEGRRICTCV